MKKKVLFYNGSLRMGGIEKVLCEVLNNLDFDKLEVHLIIEDGIKSINTMAEEIPDFIPITYLKDEATIKRTIGFRDKKKSLVNKIKYNMAMSHERNIKKQNFFKALKNIDPDLIIDFDMGLSKFSKEIDKPIVTWVHSSIKNWYKKPSKIKRLGKRLSNYDKIITVCDDMLIETKELYPELEGRLKRIYNPLNTSNIKKLGNDNSVLSEEERELITHPFILSVMRLTTYQKDFDTLIKAFKRVKEKGIEEKLYIIGNGPDKEEIKNMIKQADLDKQVLLLGEKKNPYIWMNNSNLFVHSSKFEGFGLVIVEALALGKTVVSTDCPVGPKEILMDGKYGLLTKLSSPEDLADKIERALSDTDLQRNLVDLSTERSMDFDTKTIMKEYYKLIEEL